jgi:cytochrome c biogenesis protein CcmG/thiol:disulfide interchange protein DsbE
MRRIMPLVGGLSLGVGLGIVLFFGFLKPREIPKVSDLTLGSEALPLPSQDAPAPDFELSSLSGERIQLKDYRGQIVLLNFWTTWCAPCRLEMPAFQSRSEQFAADLAVVAVNNAETPAEVQAFVDELGLHFDVLFDPEAEVQRLYLVRGYPTTFFIDRQGIIRAQHIGLLSEAQLDGYLSDLGIQE